jgi:DNA mismatch endonuclease (patch repair protein)
MIWWQMPPDRAELEARYRSSTMAAVKASRTDLEQLLAREMWRVGLRGWRRGRRTENARPDFVFVGARVVVFVDGCFWHGCPDCAKRPETNRAYWVPKIARNRYRDAQQTAALKAAGWAVLRFWGHEVEADPASCADAAKQAVMPTKAGRNVAGST